MFDCDIIDSDKNKIRKADIIFLLGIAAVSFIILIIFQLHSTTGSYAVVSYDGSSPLVCISLEQSEPQYFLIMYQGDDSTLKEFSAEEWEEFYKEKETLISSMEYNAFLYQDHEISMLYSSCPDKICVHHKPISMTGENIICLPHKLIIKISGDIEGRSEGNADDIIDGVAY